MEQTEDVKTTMLDVPSYTEFSQMDRAENDPEDVEEILEICEGE